MKTSDIQSMYDTLAVESWAIYGATKALPELAFGPMSFDHYAECEHVTTYPYYGPNEPVGVRDKDYP